MKRTTMSKKIDTRPAYIQVIEEAKKESEEAMSVFTNARNQLLLANETISATQKDIDAEIAKLTSAQNTLVEQSLSNEKLIEKITNIIE